MDDFWLMKDQFKQNLKEYVLDDRLLEYSERKIIKSQANQEAIKKIERELADFYELIGQRMLNMFGMASYRNFERLLDEC